MSTHRRLDEQTVVHPVSGTLFINERKRDATYNHLDDSLEKEPAPKEHTLDDSIYMVLERRQH